MSKIASLLLKLLGNRIAQEVIVTGLEQAAKKTDNTIDDQVVMIVRQGMANKVNPVQRVVGGKK